MTIEVAVIGIDGSGKSSNLIQCAKFFGKEYPVVILRWKSVAYIAGDRICYLSKQKAQSCSGVFDQLNFLSYRLRTIWYRLRKASLLANLQPVFCFEDRDLLLDPSILALSYLPIIRKASISARVGIMKHITSRHFCDVYIYLDVSPETAYKRVCRRHQQQGEMLSAHENLQDLRQLRSQYEAGLALLEVSHIPVCRVNTEDRSVEECSRDIVDFLHKFHVESGNK